MAKEPRDMVVVVYEVRVGVVFGTPQGMRERSSTHLFTARSAREALAHASRIADRYVRQARLVRGDATLPAEYRETDHSLGSICVETLEISGLLQLAPSRSEYVKLRTDAEVVGVAERVRMSWKCDYPGTLDQYIESAIASSKPIEAN